MAHAAENTIADRCPIDGGRVAEEKLAEFWVCSSCREILTDHELVVLATRETQREYIEKAHPNGYDRTLPKLPRQSAGLWRRLRLRRNPPVVRSERHR